jgi:hypothetical protein
MNIISLNAFLIFFLLEIIDWVISVIIVTTTTSYCKDKLKKTLQTLNKNTIFQSMINKNKQIKIIRRYFL